jgi:hypothetical protein
MKKEYPKPSYMEAVKDRALGVMGRGVHAVQKRGAGAAISGRGKQIEDAVTRAERGYKNGGYVRKASKLVKNHKC